MAKKSGFSKYFLCFLAFLIGIAGGFYVLTYLTIPNTEDVNLTEDIYYSNNPQSGAVDLSEYDEDITVHFLELGNKFTGDCVYIKTDTSDILIDCGSRASSVPTVVDYLNQYVTDGILEYVIVTHAHRDHYAGFACSNSIFDNFECEVIIDFAMTNQDENAPTYKKYVENRDAEVSAGAKHFTAQDCIEQQKTGAQQTYEIGPNSTLTILNSYYYTNLASSENDYSVCCMISSNDKNFLFTGDLEADGEGYLVSLNPDLPKMDLYKAGHHGSATSSSSTLMSKIKPKVVCVCCCAGSSEYTDNPESQFPTQTFIDNVAPYTNEIYVTTMCVDYDKHQFTSFNGNIVYACNSTSYQIFCSNNNTILKESDWFKENRVWNGH